MPTDITSAVVETLVGPETGTHIHSVVVETLVADDYVSGAINIHSVVIETLVGRIPDPEDVPVGDYTDITEQRWGRDLALTLPRNDDDDSPTQPTATGDWPTVAGRANLHAALRRRLVTAPGEMVSRPDYGGGLPLYVGALNSAADRASLANEARLNVLRDPRLERALVAVEEVVDSPQVIVSLEITPRGEIEADTISIVSET